LRSRKTERPQRQKELAEEKVKKRRSSGIKIQTRSRRSTALNFSLRESRKGY
jgi:hypothetical protein